MTSGDRLTHSSRRYAIIGTGALGGYYGARLQEAGFDVHFLLRSDFEHVRARGLQVESVAGDINLPQVNAYNDARKMPPCDVAIVALKTTQNHLLSQLLPPVVRPGTVVLTLQNGLGVEADVAETLGDRVDGDRVRIVGGLCFICSNKVGPGHIRHSDYGRILLAAYDTAYAPQGITPAIEHLAADFDVANIPYQLGRNLLMARWQKLVWNVPYNSLSVVLDALTNEMMTCDATRSLCETLMREVVVAAAAYDVRIPDDFVQQMLDHTAEMKPYKTSMKLDFDAGRPLEVEAILGNSIRAAKEASVNVPQMEMLYSQLQFLDRRNRERSQF
ncbi:MAG: putative 2-dehydropantoate 2-reductase [Cyanobacteria bacterium P01_D01_bin.123]